MVNLLGVSNERPGKKLTGADDGVNPCNVPRQHFPVCALPNAATAAGVGQRRVVGYVRDRTDTAADRAHSAVLSTGVHQ
jgi:hypothetical protein